MSWETGHIRHFENEGLQYRWRKGEDEFVAIWWIGAHMLCCPGDEHLSKTALFFRFLPPSLDESRCGYQARLGTQFSHGLEDGDLEMGHLQLGR